MEENIALIEQLTQHGGLVDVKAADADGRIGVRVVPVNEHLPVVDTLGEANAAQYNPVVKAAARHAQVVVGEQHVRGNRGGVEREPGHCNDKKQYKIYYPSSSKAYNLYHSNSNQTNESNSKVKVAVGE